MFKIERLRPGTASFARLHILPSCAVWMCSGQTFLVFTDVNDWQLSLNHPPLNWAVKQSGVARN